MPQTRRLKKGNKENLKNFLWLLLLLISCTVVLDNNIQEIMETVIRYEVEAQRKITENKIKIGADAVVLNFYTTDYSSRIRYLVAGESAFNVQRAYTDNSSFAELYEYMLNDEIWWVDNIDDMDEGTLKSSLKQNNVKAVMAVPIYGSDGILVGYLAASWRDSVKTSVSTISDEMRYTADEISRLNGIF